jgi:tripartite ATP-independent transporter DctP family solute receptor
MQRRDFIKAGVAGAVAASLPAQRAQAQAAEFSYKFAHNLPVTHPIHLRAKEMVDGIREETKGRVDIQIFPSSQLGSDTDVLSQLRSGGVEFFTLSGLILATLVPVAAITGIAFAFPDYAKVWQALDGELGAYVRAQMLAKANLIALDRIWDNGFRQITSSTKPIVTADDLKGFKIRVPVSPLWTSMFKALDASPASINFVEVYSALQTRIVDGQENPLALIATAKLYEVQKYCSLTGHMWDGYWFMANRAALERIPPELRAIVVKHVNSAAMRERADVALLNASMQRELTDKGMIFNQAKSDTFRDKLRKAGFYAEWKAKFGDEAWVILEKFSGKLV